MATPDLMEWAAQAEAWADRAGSIAMANLGRAAVREKTDGTEVTDTDMAIQSMLVDAIRQSFPGHAIIAEESLATRSMTPAPDAAPFCWVIDPLDGTRNYVRGFPGFATSIAVMESGRPIVGVVRWHTTGQTYSAVLGHGARAGGRTLHCASAPMDSNTLIGAQLGPNHATDETVAPWLRRWAVRNLGATALHLALVAAGHLGAAYARDCWIWDLAAGALLISEAGGRCTGTSGSEIFPVDLRACARTNYPLIAGGPDGHRLLLEDLKRRGLDAG